MLFVKVPDICFTMFFNGKLSAGLESSVWKACAQQRCPLYEDSYMRTLKNAAFLYDDFFATTIPHIAELDLLTRDSDLWDPNHSDETSFADIFAEEDEEEKYACNCGHATPKRGIHPPSCNKNNRP